MAKRAASSTDAIVKALRAYGLALPGAHPKSPWPDHEDLAVNDKTFASLGVEGQPFHLGCKLPQSGAIALMLPWATPIGYGLGKSGWVSAAPPAGTPLDVAMFEARSLESYRAQAPKKLLKQLAG